MGFEPGLSLLRQKYLLILINLAPAPLPTEPNTFYNIIKNIVSIHYRK